MGESRTRSSTTHDPTESSCINLYPAHLEPQSLIRLTIGSVHDASECSFDTFTLHYPTSPRHGNTYLRGRCEYECHPPPPIQTSSSFIFSVVTQHLHLPNEPTFSRDSLTFRRLSVVAKSTYLVPPSGHTETCPCKYKCHPRPPIQPSSSFIFSSVLVF